MTPPKDSLYASPLERIGQFEFSEDVAEVFDDMIHRSIPGYDAIIAMIGSLAATNARSASTVYDLGCSLGTATLAIRKNIPADAQIIAVDNSAAMLNKCRQRLLPDRNRAAVTFLCEDIQHVPIANASFVVLNFTLQFIAPGERERLLHKICDGMIRGGALVISEKIAFEDPQEQQLQERWHEDFKRINGYSDLEIAQKRTALENVLIPDTLTTHTTRLKQAGFKQVSRWFQCFNFASLVAFK